MCKWLLAIYLFCFVVALVAFVHCSATDAPEQSKYLCFFFAYQRVVGFVLWG